MIATSRNIIVPAVLLIVGIGARPVEAGSAPPGYKLFVSAADHYRLAYPRSWTTSGKGAHQYFYGRRAHLLITSVTIFHIPGLGGMPLDSFAQAVVQADTRIGATVTDRSRFRVGGQSAYLISGRYRRKIGSHVASEAFSVAVFVGRGAAWEITYSADPSRFLQDRRVYLSMLATFAFT